MEDGTQTINFEYAEKLEEVLEFILGSAPLIGSGKDGVVLYVDTQSTPLEFDFMNSNKSDLALKVLKVFRSGEARREYSVQMNAYNLLNNTDGAARVPKPIFIKTQHLSNRDRDHLNQLGCNLENDAEIILMDFIDGKDLATIIYDFVLEKNKIEKVDFLSFEHKQEMVAMMLGFEFSKSKGDFREMMANKENLKKLVKFLQKNNFRFEAGHIKALKLAITTLERNGIFHNDLHERNIMIDKNGTPYIIDFGRSVANKSDQTSDDGAVIKRLEEINGPTAEEIQLQKKNEADENLWNKYATQQFNKIKKEINILLNNLENSSSDIIKSYVISSLSIESDLDKIFGSIKYILNKNKKYLTKINYILNGVLETKDKSLSPFMRNKIKHFIKFIQ